MAYRHGGDALISHLCFADDMIIFANGQKQSIRRVLHCIEHYERASGQLVNRDKSGIILPRWAPAQQIHRLENLTGFRHQQQPFTYQEVPLFKGPRKIFLYDDLVQKVRSKDIGLGFEITFTWRADYSDSFCFIFSSSLPTSDFEASQGCLEEAREHFC
ncbi:Reverse transcriptase domain-containing protein [Abeliophyllum distichum]|uniref:Reverse transcriptase domain-containing protein n=1 Tax=Abeliophyllum distichum TaxID=126358 RepID=A0ABD1VR06_9LAMI